MQSSSAAENEPGADELSSRYDEVPYLSAAFVPSRPDNLSVVGVLAGLTAAAVKNCRVLEIGCAAGGNLLPMAQVLPDSRFLGIDFSAKPIEQGRELADRAGLKNIELRCQSVLDFQDPEPFDYIIAHGFYSWVPPRVREQAMIVCQRSLAPSGLAYFSYNTLPGWHVKRISRDMMLFHSRAAGNSAQRVARARQIMAIAAAYPAPEPTPYSIAVKQLAGGIASYPDWYLDHDELGLVNDPVYFEDFVSQAQSHQLRYIGGAQPNMNLFSQLPAPLRRQLQAFSSDPVALEQYADFIWGSQYRDSVLCRSDAPASAVRGAPAVANMFVAGWLLEQPFAAERQKRHEARFLNPHNKREILVSDAGLIAVLRRLARAWPHAVAFGELFSAASQAAGAACTGGFLANQMLSWYQASAVEFWTRPTDFISSSPTRFCVSPLARLQAQAAAPIVSLRHEECRFADPLVREFIPCMDGTRDRAALLAALAGIWNQQSAARLNEFLENVLTTLSNHSLFISGI